MTNSCRVCNSTSESFGRAVVLSRYDIEYFRCVDCGFVQTETPYWLDEAYQNAIIPTDVGLIGRNQRFSRSATLVLRYLLPSATRCVDYGGGYGIFTRMMRDFGHDFAHMDPYCENLFAKGHEAAWDDKRRDLLTAFEVWEHMADPVLEVSKMDALADNWLVSTMLMPKHNPRPGQWWYYAEEGGQHVSIWTEKALQAIASQFKRHVVSTRKGLHLFTTRPINPMVAKPIIQAKAFGILNRFRSKKSLVQNDYQVAREKIRTAALSKLDDDMKPSPSKVRLHTLTQLDTPVALMMFNRPNHTKQVLEAIRQAQPKQLFVISDGPRPGRSDDEHAVQECRNLIDDVDWDCDVKKIYADANMGCGRRVASGISAAFESAERLIILEDDCLPDPSFFRFCEELLIKYERDERVMAVSGNNFQGGIKRGDASYYFSKYMHCWGWATWRRSWQHFDLAMDHWPAWKSGDEFARLMPISEERQMWAKAFEKVRSGKMDTWDFSWVLSCWMRGGLTVLPNVNLVSNIGFGGDATHTLKDGPLSNLPVQHIGDLVHPKTVERSLAADEYTYQTLFAKPKKRWSDRVANWLPKRKAA